MLVSAPQPTSASRKRGARSATDLIRGHSVVFSATSLIALTAAAALIAGILATSAFASVNDTASVNHRPAPISAGEAFALPSTQKCVSGRQLIITVRSVAHVTWRVVTVDVNGKRFETIKRAQIGKPVRLIRLPAGRFVVSISAKTTTGRSVTATRTYRPCAVTTSSYRLTVTLAGSGSGRVTGGGLSCSSSCSQNYPAGTKITLTGSAAARSSFAGWSGAGCSGTGTCTVTMNAARSLTATFAANSPPAETLTIGLAGTGWGSVTGSGIACPGTCSKTFAAGTVVTLTATAASGSRFSGWSGAGCSATGSCPLAMSSNQSVTATFGANTSSSVEPGSYSGDTSAGYGVSLYVSPDSSQIQDVVVNVAPTCTPSFSYGETEVEFASIPIAADGSFSGSSTVDGVVDNAPAKSTYLFSGQFSGTQVEGQVRDDITFSNGTSFSCTTNLTSWSATRDAQGASQSASSPPSGSYSGAPWAGYGVSLYVSPDSSQIQDVVVNVAPTCTPSFSYGETEVEFASIPIAADGSFSGSSTVDGVVDNAPAKSTYLFSGQFSGTQVEGQVRDDITFSNGTSFSCTTNLTSWSATRDAQGASQSASSPPSGSYSGDTWAGYGVSLYVSPDSSQIQDVVVNVAPTCTPSFSYGETEVEFASIPIAADGSFSGSSTVDGVVDNAPAKSTYLFSGQFSGTQVEGQVRDDITFSNGTSFSCTTNLTSWSATRDAQGASQSASSPPSGSYSGDTWAGYGVSLYVSPDSSQIQDVVVNVAPTCTPSFSYGETEVEFASIPIAADGSFSGSSTVDGVVDNAPAKSTYLF